MKERIVAGALVAASAGYLILARGFVATFVADPIGPRAFPLGIGALLLLASALLLWAPSGWPRFSWRHAAVIVALGLYTASLRSAGFIVATTGLVGVVVVMFGGPWRRGLLLGFAVCVGFAVVFAYVLSVPLPMGTLFGDR